LFRTYFAGFVVVGDLTSQSGFIFSGSNFSFRTIFFVFLASFGLGFSFVALSFFVIGSGLG
jgi:hypothetical protein